MNKAIGAIAAVVSTTGFAVASLGGAAGAAVECSSESYGQSNLYLYMATGLGGHDTGLSVPAPAAGETLTVANSWWTTYDYLAPETSPSRADEDQLNERVGLAVGGTTVGSLSYDLPDSVAEGATDDWSSGLWSGSFGATGSSVAGGAITLHHASQSGFDESANSFIVKSFGIELERCLTTEEPTTTTAPAETTTTIAATTTTAPGATTTAPAATTTSVASVAPTTAAPTTVAGAAAAPTTAVASAAPTTTVARGALPVTGGRMAVPLMLAALAGLTGAALMVVRRRPS